MKDYYELNFTEQLDSPSTKVMVEIIDPIGKSSVLINQPVNVLTGERMLRPLT